MKHQIILILLLIICFSCSEDKQSVDSIIINANVYTVNSDFSKAEAFAVKDGKFLEIGTSRDIQMIGGC